MRARWLSALALLILALPASAADPAPAAPALVVRVRAVEGLMDDFEYLGGLLDQEDKAKEIGGFVRSYLGPKAFAAVDAKGPLAVYASFTPNVNDATVVAVIPVKDEKLFLDDVLARFKVKATKKGDVYALEHPDLPPVVAPFLRFAHKHAYVTFRTAEPLKDGKLLTPEALSLAGDPGLMSATLRLDGLPVTARQLVLQQVELRLADAKAEKPAGETPAQHALKGLAIDAVAFRVKQLINEGKELTVKLDVDRKKNDLTGELSLVGKDGTALSADIKALGQARTPLAGLLVPEAAVNLGMNVGLPADLKKSLGPVVDELIDKTKDGVPEGPPRDLAEGVLKSVEPTLKAGVLDAALSFRGPDAKGRLTLVSGLRVVDGKKVEKAVRDVVDVLPGEAKARIKLDLAKAGGTGVHKVVGGEDADPNVKRLFGDDADLFVAFRDDAIFLAIGPAGLDDLKAALTAAPKTGPLLQADMAAARSAPFQDTPEKKKLAAEVAGKVFGADAKGNDAARFAVTGGDALSAKFSLKGGVVTFLALFDQAQKEKAKE